MKKILFLFGGLALIALKPQAQSTVTDYDGNVYSTVAIGTQVWMQENLRTTHYHNGDLIPNVPDNAGWGNLITGGRCYYNNDSATYRFSYAKFNTVMIMTLMFLINLLTLYTEIRMK